MKDFPTCPKCHGVLKNEYAPIGPNEEILIRSCEKVDHTFKCTLSGNNEIQRITIRISTNPLIKVCWNIEDNKVIVSKGTVMEMLKKGGGDLELPFFEPDFTDYNRLVDKVKTLLIFS